MNSNREILLFIIYNLLNQNQIVTVDSIRENLELIQSQELDLKEGIKDLVKNKLIKIDNNKYINLTDKGKEEAYQVSKERNKEDFNQLLKTAISSKAYLDFCEEISGYRIYLFNMMDKIQLDYIFNSIKISRNDIILDLGCGTGSILMY